MAAARGRGLSAEAFTAAALAAVLGSAVLRRLVLWWWAGPPAVCAAGVPSITVVVLTAPRPGHPPHLARTLESLFQQWGDGHRGALFDVLVTNHFGPNHTALHAAARRYAHSAVPLRWIDKPLPLPKEVDHVFHRQRAHVHSALAEALAARAEYVLLLEDDFPMCPGGWREMLDLLCWCRVAVAESRGVFIGTGGSGALIAWAQLPELLQALDVVPRLRDPAWKARVDVCIRSMNQKSAQKSKEEKVAEMDPWCEHEIKHDVILQRWLLARPLCVSHDLLIHHIGYASSTLEGNGDLHTKPDWQCGWRQPLTTARNAVMR